MNDVGDDDDTSVDAGPARIDGGGPNEFADARPAERCKKMDILFVVDDSGSMVQEQTNLATNFPDFIDIIDTYMTGTGDLLDYRIAVTTTGRDVSYSLAPPLPGFPPLQLSESGDNGEFRQDCGMSRRWLERGDNDVAGTFSCVAQVGTGGPSLEMPFQTTQLAFRERITDGTNSGFLREDALLAIVILTDEDDCSRADNNFEIATDQCDPEVPENITIAQHLTFLDDLKGDRARWATAVIAGPGPGPCSSGFGEAFEAKRLKRFVQDTGTNAIFSSICAGDLATALSDALDTFNAACDGFPPID